MSHLKRFSFLSLVLALFLTTFLFAEETVVEKSKKHADNSARAFKLGLNRVDETFCKDSEIKCAAKKAGNRVNEAKDSAIDGAKATKEKLD